jgi:uncharacterized membrane protein YgdD (TMEM256/DUF423 family)
MELSQEQSQQNAFTVVARPAFWKRAVWMRLGALNGLIALGIILLSENSAILAMSSVSLRHGAQIQFMHGMATLACATFMNIGAIGARRAPAFFLFGILLYCVPTYAVAVASLEWVAVLKPLGVGAFAIGWLIMASSARDIDKH